MPDSESRWVEVSPSQFAHEREGLDSVRSWLLQLGPAYRAWSNFEFRDSQGGWHEVDLLVLGPRGLFLIELKHYYGTLSGDDTRWRRNGGRVETSPLLLARRKAQRLASKLKDAARQWAIERKVEVGNVVGIVPYVEEAVFLHHETFVSHLSGSAALGLYGLEDPQAQERSNLPPLSDLITEPARSGKEIRPHTVTILAKLMERIGLVQRREREAGSWVIQEGVVDEGISAQGYAWQDWRCTHLADPTRQGRVRMLPSPPDAAERDVKRRVEVARNEFRLSRTLKHEAILTPEDYVAADFGVGLVYPDDTTYQRLDLWLAENAPVSVDTALSVIGQIGEGLRYAHEHGVAHRTLGAGSIWVRPRSGASDEFDVQIRDWSFAGRLEPAAHGVTSLVAGSSAPQSAGTDEDRWLSEAFRAPESQWNADDRIRLDVFSLGALAAYIVTGAAPASSAAELRRQLGESQSGIDIITLGGAAPEKLRELIREATHPIVGKRTESIAMVLADLDKLQVELSAPEDAAPHPLDAIPGMKLGDGRFVVEKRLGRGSTARGLLVTDTTIKSTQYRVLKLALDEDKAAVRLTAEAEVLRALKDAKLPAKLIEGPLDIDGCTALLLESAGSHTLAEELRPGMPVPLDFLQRWGTDLLDAIVELDRLGVDHRDIKPSNIGVRKNPGNRKEHLVLFDFSLTRAAAEETEAGTPPYRDPFLGHGRRRRFDSAAERYSVAVVMFEMATGYPPQFGDGMTLPTLITDEATIDPGVFPPGLAGDFTDFFRTALRRDAAQRFDSATVMRHAWTRIFSTDVTTQAPTDEDDRRAEAATLDTPLDKAGLTARGLSALARFHVHTVRDFLIKVDAGHPYARVAPYTRQHLQQRRAAWEKRLGLPRPVDEGALADGLELTLRSLEQSCGAANATARRQVVRLVVGSEGRLDAFATTAVLGQAASRRLTASQAADHIEEALGAWATDATSRGILDAVGAALDARVDELGGAITLGEAAAAVLDAAREPIRSKDTVRRAQGLVRLALERRRQLRERGSETPPMTVRRQDGRVILLGSKAALFDPLQALGRAAEDLVLRSAGPDVGTIVPAATVERELRAALKSFDPLFKRQTNDDEEGGPPSEATSAGRLIRVAAELAPHARAAATLDLHHVDLPQTVALAETFRGYASPSALSPDDVRARVRDRFPAVQKLPQRPALDAIVAESGTDLRWEDSRVGYTVPQRSLSTTSAATTFTVPARDAIGSLRDITSARLEESIDTRSFLAIGMPGQELTATAGLLADRFYAQVLDITGLLIEAMRAEAEKHGARWDVVVAADAHPEGSGERTNLNQLVAMSIASVWAEIEGAIGSGAEDTPVVLTELAPLARYRHLGELSRWSDVARPRRRAVWALVPQTAGSRGAVIDGLPLPLGSPGQYVTLAARWEPAQRTAEKQNAEDVADVQATGNGARR